MTVTVTASDSEALRRAYTLLVLVYTFLWSEHGTPDANDPTSSVRRFLASDEQLMGGYLPDALTRCGSPQRDRATASMILARMRSKTHPLTRDAVSLIAIEHSKQGRTIVFNYDPSALSVEEALTRAAQERGNDRASTNPAQNLRPFTWNRRKLTWLYNDIARESAVEGRTQRVVKNPFTRLRNKWDERGVTDIQSGLDELTACGVGRMVTHLDTPVLVLLVELAEALTCLCPETDANTEPASTPATGDEQERPDRDRTTVGEAPSSPPKHLPPQPMNPRSSSRIPVRVVCLTQHEEAFMRRLRLLVHERAECKPPSELVYTREELRGDGVENTDWNECLTRFCEAGILEIVDERHWKVLQDPRGIKTVRITERSIMRVSPARLEIAKRARAAYVRGHENGEMNTRALYAAASDDAGLAERTLSALRSGSLGIVHATQEQSRTCFLTPEALSPCDLIPGDGTYSRTLSPGQPGYREARARYGGTVVPRQKPTPSPAAAPAPAVSTPAAEPVALQATPPAPSVVEAPVITAPLLAESSRKLPPAPSTVGLTVEQALAALEQRASLLNQLMILCRTRIAGKRAEIEALQREEELLEGELLQVDKMREAMDQQIRTVLEMLIGNR